jgi:hypothetical protein
MKNEFLFFRCLIILFFSLLFNNDVQGRSYDNYYIIQKNKYIFYEYDIMSFNKWINICSSLQPSESGIWRAYITNNSKNKIIEQHNFKTPFYGGIK